MGLIHRHNRCVGVTLFRWGKKQLEIWYGPAGEWINPHHHDFDSVLIMLAGEMKGTIGDRTGTTGGCDFLRRFNVPAGVEHDAVVTGKFVLFLNYETWKTKPTSAAENFVS